MSARRLFVAFALFTALSSPAFAQKASLAVALQQYGASDVLTIDDDGNRNTRAWVLVKTDNTLQLVTLGAGGFCFESPFSSPIPADPKTTYDTVYDGPVQVIKIRNSDPSVVVGDDGVWRVIPAAVTFIPVTRDRCR